MIFSELYSAYYNTVAAVLAAAVSHPLTESELRRIVGKNAFGESALHILPALKEERWQLIRADGTTPIRRRPDMPLTMLQRRWLKSIAMDPRIRLFGDLTFDFPEAAPLFRPEDILVFDKYSDGDPYEDETYIANFRLVLDAVRKKYPLHIEMASGKGELLAVRILPERLEYSEKDDKFRLTGKEGHYASTINLGRIISCRPSEEPGKYRREPGPARQRGRQKRVVFELVDERNALERALMHFAHFRKQAERTADDRYRVTVYYDREDETEMVIRVLSFGPMVRVTEPRRFVGLIKQRLADQKSCGL